MAIKLKQYLENSWYRGASQDRQTGYAAQFQYGEGINIRDMKNGVCLAGGYYDRDLFNGMFTYVIHKSKLYIITYEGKIYEWSNMSLVYTISFSGTVTQIVAESFGEYIYVAIGSSFVQIDPSTSPRTGTDYSGGASYADCMLNFANTYLLIGVDNTLYRMDVTLGVPTFKGIRDFESGYYIYGLTQEGNYLKIYTSDGTDTKVHYAKGTFDVEDTGLVQTVTFKGMAINKGAVTSDQGNDYVLFKIGADYKLAKITGYSKIDIRWTQTRDGEKVFEGWRVGPHRPNIIASDGVVFAAMAEGIWTFTEYNGWLRGGCVEFPEHEGFITTMIRYGEELFVAKTNSLHTEYRLRVCNLSFHPTQYQTDGFIIGRVFDGGCAGLFKKNDQATITYHMPTETKMELSYRYDRSSFGYSKSNFLPIKSLEDTDNCYDIVVPTTPGGTASLLQLEDNYDILLENGSGILLEDLLVCPFNKPRNLLEYRFDLHTDNPTKTPILFEHSLTYYDYMRKYR